MHINEYGACLDCKELEVIYNKPMDWEIYKEGITVQYDKYKGKWGYTVSYSTKTLGVSKGLDITDFIYNSKNEALEVAKIEVVVIVDKYFKGKQNAKNGHIDYLFNKAMDEYKLCVAFSNREDCWTNTFTRIVDDKLWNHLYETFPKDNIEYFTYIDDDKKYYNPNKKEEFKQLELF